jgi:hypothetical protein
VAKVQREYRKAINIRIRMTNGEDGEEVVAYYAVVLANVPNTSVTTLRGAT